MRGVQIVCQALFRERRLQTQAHTSQRGVSTEGRECTYHRTVEGHAKRGRADHEDRKPLVPQAQTLGVVRRLKLDFEAVRSLTIIAVGEGECRRLGTALLDICVTDRYSFRFFGGHGENWTGTIRTW